MVQHLVQGVLRNALRLWHLLFASSSNVKVSHHKLPYVVNEAASRNDERSRSSRLTQN